MIVAIEYEAGVENAWSTFMEAVPKVLAFLVILVVGFLVAKAVGKAVTKLLQRANFDRFVQRGVVRHARSRSRYDASQIAGKLAYYAGALLTLVLAFGVFGGDNAVSQMLDGVVAFIPKLVVAIVIVLIAAAVASWVKDIVSSALGGLSYGGLLATIASGAILVTGIFMALTQLEIAPAIVTGLYYAVLAALVGVTIVAVGGGGIAPMRARWERALSTVDAEAPKVKELARAAKEQRAAEAHARAQRELAQQALAAQAAAQQQRQPEPTQQYAAQPYPDQQFGAAGDRPRTGAPMPPSAYTAPADHTIDLSREDLQRLGSPGGFAPPGDQGAPPAAGPRP
ncbi:MAG: hypothetical protein ABIM89_01785 [Mycobacteriales bacterium]